MMKEVNKIDELIRTKILAHHPAFNTNADQYLKWAPDFFVLAFDALGIKTSHKFKDHLKIIALSEAILKSAVNPLKYFTHTLRPNASLHFNSFPSGHTATCFMGAEIIRQELKDHYKVLSLSGYAMAVTTGALRLYKNKHWLSDVVAGAVIGVLSARLAYVLFKKMKKIKR